MTIIRSFIFANNTAYDIDLTMAYLRDVHDRTQRCEYRFDEIISALGDAKYQADWDIDRWLPNYFNGVITQHDIWLREFGVEDHTFDGLDEVLTLDSYSVSDEGFALEGEECISDEGEVELVTIVVEIHDMELGIEHADI